jgi:hypothetical protein
MPQVHHRYATVGGHFILESAGDEVAALIRDFLARRLDGPARPAVRLVPRHP